MSFPVCQMRKATASTRAASTTAGSVDGGEGGEGGEEEDEAADAPPSRACNAAGRSAEKRSLHIMYACTAARTPQGPPERWLRRGKGERVWGGWGGVGFRARANLLSSCGVGLASVYPDDVPEAERARRNSHALRIPAGDVVIREGAEEGKPEGLQDGLVHFSLSVCARESTCARQQAHVPAVQVPCGSGLVSGAGRGARRGLSDVERERMWFFPANREQD